MDNSPKLRYDAHQKDEGHNRKSTRLSMLAGKMRFVLFQSSMLVKWLSSVRYTLYLFVVLKTSTNDLTRVLFVDIDILYSICLQIIYLLHYLRYQFGTIMFFIIGTQCIWFMDNGRSILNRLFGDNHRSEVIQQIYTEFLFPLFVLIV